LAPPENSIESVEVSARNSENTARLSCAQAALATHIDGGFELACPSEIGTYALA
jgi:hypothetical protein